MKKKIKDLTFFDVSEICSKHKYCDECPLYILGRLCDKKMYYIFFYSSLQNEWGDIIEQEVDI